MQVENINVSHSLSEETKESIRQRIIETGDLPYITTDKQLLILEELMTFSLGRFLIERKGLNGYWTQYIVQYPEQKQKQKMGNLEKFLLTKAPTTLATQERYQIFKKIISREIKPGKIFASIPCGLMGEFFTLEADLRGIKFVAVDIDQENFLHAQKLVLDKQIEDCQVKFIKEDAWSIKDQNIYDLISSNGLNIYVKDNNMVIDLYKIFYKALKPGGVLVTSSLTIPPISGLESEWRLDEINAQDMLLQKVVFSDILKSTWQNYRSSEETRSQLKIAGFCDVEIFFDKAHIFPTFKAVK